MESISCLGNYARCVSDFEVDGGPAYHTSKKSMHQKDALPTSQASASVVLLLMATEHNRDFVHLLQDPGPAPADVLGSTEATGAAGVMGLFGRGGADAKAELWALGERAAILLHLDAAALIPHVLPGRSGKLHIEARRPVCACCSCMRSLQTAAQNNDRSLLANCHSMSF